ncbi:MAG: HD domain-containing protein [bacterium]|nr:HD domain-containing protein [bacterium]
MNLFNSEHKISLMLILVSTALMMFNLLKFSYYLKKFRQLIFIVSNKIFILLYCYWGLIVFFIFNYWLVAYLVYKGIFLSSFILIGVIFLADAVFVLMDIYLYHRIFTSLELEHNSSVEQTQQLIDTEDVTIFALAYQAELHDQDTGKHIERTCKYVELLAVELAKKPEYKRYLTTEYIHDLVKSAPLHDIGKVGVPDSILKKSGKLTPEEFEEIKKHCEDGANVLKAAVNRLKFQSFLDIGVQLALSHHEKWDGSGYPYGLKGQTIPISGRIMALADVYDALTSKRCYKNVLSHEAAKEYILSECNKQFDPEVVDAFLHAEDEFLGVLQSKYFQT